MKTLIFILSFIFVGNVYSGVTASYEDVACGYITKPLLGSSVLRIAEYDGAKGYADLREQITKWKDVRFMDYYVTGFGCFANYGALVNPVEIPYYQVDLAIYPAEGESVYKVCAGFTEGAGAEITARECNKYKTREEVEKEKAIDSNN